MIIHRDDPRFWDVRTRERRLRSGEISSADVDAQLAALPDASDKATASVPLEEPDERRLMRPANMPRIIAPGPEDMLDDDFADYPYDDDDEDDDDDDDDDLPLK